MTSGKEGAIGIIAGAGGLPAVVASEAKRKGHRVVVIAGVDGAFQNGSADVVHRIFVGQWDLVLTTLRNEEVTKVIAVGRIDRTLLMDTSSMDERFMRIVAGLQSQDDVALMRAFAADIEQEGFVIGRQEEFIQAHSPIPGVIGVHRPTADQWKDIHRGYEVAKALASVGAGQTAVVKNGAVLSVEAICGTDATIRRAAGYGGHGAVAVKVAHPERDSRFDLPVIGVGTIEAAVETGLAALAFEAGSTIWVGREEAEALAIENGIALVAYAPEMETT